MDLFTFRLDLSDALAYAGKPVTTRERGRVDDNMRIRRDRNEVPTINEMKYDTVDHLPQRDDKNEPTSCNNKNRGKFRSHWYCHTCGVY